MGENRRIKEVKFYHVCVCGEGGGVARIRPILVDGKDHHRGNVNFKS